MGRPRLRRRRARRAAHDGTLATFECHPYAQYPGGDHTIFVAEVRQLRFRDGEPLVFCAGGYRQLAEREVCE